MGEDLGCARTSSYRSFGQKALEDEVPADIQRWRQFAAGAPTPPSSGPSALDELRGDGARLNRESILRWRMLAAGAPPDWLEALHPLLDEGNRLDHHARPARSRSFNDAPVADGDIELRDRIVRSIVRRPDGVFVFPVSAEYASSKGAKHWIEASQARAYRHMRDAELELFGAFFEDLETPVGEVCDFGPGDGDKGAWIAERLLRKQRALKYTGIDVNPALLSEARLRLHFLKYARTRSGLDLQLAFDDSVDLEDEASIHAASRPDAPHDDAITVAILAGQTIGNPGRKGQRIMLECVHNRLAFGSLLLVGAALVPGGKVETKNTLEGYRTPHYRELILGPLKEVGVAESGEFKIEWDDEKSSVVGYFDFTREAAISSTSGTQLRFKPGDRAQVFHSHRFREDELKKLLEDTGFADVNIRRSDLFPYALASARVTGDPREAGKS